MGLGYWELTWVLLVPGILYASWVDGRERRVPNWLNAVLLVAGLAMQIMHPEGQGAWAALGGVAVGFGVLIVPWLAHGMGAGDVKLMAAIGAWLGAGLTLWAFVAGALYGGIIAVIMTLYARKLRHAMVNLNTIVFKMSTPAHWFTEVGSAKSFGETSQLLPYGIPLTMGSITVLIGVTLGWWSL